ncbi:Detected protein of unknown function [Hibiscus syriacus]|uniref:Tubby C-terminal domain-containing protein n=1 Tax=Hibiscus syriacus TaxID=106335 RepID=A0A6A2YZX9_HIBSY|nr:Detected protein of unknown function [Hibiscus syriacus]
MPIKAFIREIGNISKNSSGRKDNSMRGRSDVVPEASSSSSPLLLGGSSTGIEQGHWSDLPPEILIDILQRVETNEKCWPGRRDVLVCRFLDQGMLRFNALLGGKGKLQHIDCIWVSVLKDGRFFKIQPLSGDLSKQLLVAKKVRRATHTDFMIYLKGGDFSKSSNDYIGKLRSNFLGTKFNISESQPQHYSSAQSGYRSYWKTYLKSVPPRVPTTKVNTASISYELNVLRTKGLRRLKCMMYSIPVSAVKGGGTAPTPIAFGNCPEDHPSPPIGSKGKSPCIGFNSSDFCEPAKSGQITALLVANVEPIQDISAAERDKVILQFGKIGKDIFTMDYRYPLSAFQAFAICLSSFGTKPVCE